ncbi:MAG: D-alanine--D-alanine ligase family protein [Pyrinomonadaceae bacterium]
MEKIRIGVIFGGRSGEHEVSVRSAATVIKEIDKSRFDVVPVAIGKDGGWINPKKSVEFFAKDIQSLFANELEDFPSGQIMFSSDTYYRGLVDLSAPEGADRLYPLDVVFPVLHGTFGEDGTIQGLFEMSGIPYVGCGVLASSGAMDKVVMKTLFRDAGLPICDYVWFLRDEWEANNNLVLSQVETKLGFPCFVKPANMGSSVGVTKANDADELRRGIDLAAEFDSRIIVEEHLEMREIECAVIGNNNPEASKPGEYLVHDKSKKFLDYEEKYAATGNNEFVVPALVSPALAEKIREMSVEAYRAVAASGLSRVDFFLRTDSGAILVNEVNTMPGLTDASGFPKMWAGSGKSFTDVISELVDLAFERAEDKARNRTSL